ncbi:MAG: SPOR domain-containing protein [Xanthobacteraceae bacterium]
MGSTTADASTAPETPSVAPAQAPVRTAPRAAMQQERPAPAPRAEANGPLSIVPNQDGAAPAPARTRTALARPAEPSPEERAEPAPSAATGGYAVQVTSQRSEADAQAEFRTLRTKFPTQFGGREPIIRRADLGAKGVYYRALVGPFASADQAAGMCSSLKAAGGSCIVQRN